MGPPSGFAVPQASHSCWGALCTQPALGQAWIGSSSARLGAPLLPRWPPPPQSWVQARRPCAALRVPVCLSCSSPLLAKDRAPPECPCPACPRGPAAEEGSPRQSRPAARACSSCWASETRVPRHPERPVLPGGEAPQCGSQQAAVRGSCWGPLHFHLSLWLWAPAPVPPAVTIRAPGCRVPRGGSHPGRLR